MPNQRSAGVAPFLHDETRGRADQFSRGLGRVSEAHETIFAVAKGSRPIAAARTLDVTDRAATSDRASGAQAEAPRRVHRELPSRPLRERWIAACPNTDCNNDRPD